jgi:hypothetical protein
MAWRGRCASFLPQLLPVCLTAVRDGEEALCHTVLKHLSILVSIVKEVKIQALPPVCRVRYGTRVH